MGVWTHQFFKGTPHSSKIRSFCSMEMPWSRLTYTRAFIIYYRWAGNEKWKILVSVVIFLFLKNGKFRSISLSHFLKHKHIISEEWHISKNNLQFYEILFKFLTTCQLFRGKEFKYSFWFCDMKELLGSTIYINMIF